MREHPLERFIPEAMSGCWLWTGPLHESGHGNLSKKWGHRQAHRLFFEHFSGPIPPGALICHKCDVPSCVNPDHLYAGDHKSNAVDVVVRKRRVWVSWNKQEVTHMGKTMCLSEWQEYLKVPVYQRLHRGWSIEEALTRPNRFAKRSR